MGFPWAIIPPIASAVGSFFGGGKQIDPRAMNPMFGNPINQAFGDWLFDRVSTGSEYYPGQMSADPSQTRLPEVFNAWQPMDFGTMFLANQLQGLPQYGQSNPMLSQMQQWGGTGGPGHRGMSSAMQYGAPSQAGQFMSNMAQYGVSSEGAGRGLANIAQFGAPTSSLGNLAMSYVQGRQPNRYMPPMIPQRQIQRRA